MSGIVTIGHTEGAGTASEDSSPVTGSHFLRCSFEGVVTGSSLCISVSSEVVLVLDTCEQVVLTQGDVHLIGDHRRLGLSQVTIGEDITRVSPCGIVILTIVHQDLHHRIAVTILRRTGLILERVSSTQGVVNLTELRVQLTGNRRELILSIVTAGE